ncbi:MAG: hypothetical protein JNL79_28760 [Myxococcales bacterium]|nr:hypothetical protein [Myxococcales bacterium]
MAEAKRAIYELTADDKAREAVRQRDNDAVARRFLREDGAREALVAALESLAGAPGVRLEQGERAHWHAASVGELEEAIVHLGAHRALPPR